MDEKISKFFLTNFLKGYFLKRSLRNCFSARKQVSFYRTFGFTWVSIY
eukprot:UN20218